MDDAPAKAPILVVGIGNILLRDEGIGVHVVRAMADRSLPADVELLDGGTAGADLLDTISDRDKVILIDALDADVPPGTIVRLEAEDLAAGASDSISLHEFGLAETLQMAKHLGCMPLQVTVLAVRPQDVRSGLELSAEMRSWLPGLVQAVLDELRVPT